MLEVVWLACQGRAPQRLAFEEGTGLCKTCPLEIREMVLAWIRSDKEPVPTKCGEPPCSTSPDEIEEDCFDPITGSVPSTDRGETVELPYSLEAVVPPTPCSGFVDNLERGSCEIEGPMNMEGQPTNMSYPMERILLPKVVA
jgi:hypothetical protein